MRPVLIRDRDMLEAHLRSNASFHAYGMCDLDDHHWPHTTWYGLTGADGRPEAVVLIYTAFRTPVLLAIEPPQRAGPLRRLVEALLPQLPPEMYCHVDTELLSVLRQRYSVESHGEHLKMALADRSRLDRTDTACVQRLTPQDVPEMLSLYDVSYPGHFFEPSMLDIGPFYGVRGPEGRLLAIAGLHGLSRHYRVAALGNIVTHPDYRGRGLARIATATLCKDLLGYVDDIGLNVQTENAPAVAIYRRLGFSVVGTYLECAVHSSFR